MNGTACVPFNLMAECVGMLIFVDGVGGMFGGMFV